MKWEEELLTPWCWDSMQAVKNVDFNLQLSYTSWIYPNFSEFTFLNLQPECRGVSPSRPLKNVYFVFISMVLAEWAPITPGIPTERLPVQVTDKSVTPPPPRFFNSLNVKFPWRKLATVVSPWPQNCCDLEGSHCRFHNYAKCTLYFAEGQWTTDDTVGQEQWPLPQACLWVQMPSQSHSWFFFYCETILDLNLSKGWKKKAGLGLTRVITTHV